MSLTESEPVALLLSVRETIVLRHTACLYDTPTMLSQRLTQADEGMGTANTPIDGFVKLSVEIEEYEYFLSLYQIAFGKFYTEGGRNKWKVTQSVPL